MSRDLHYYSDEELRAELSRRDEARDLPSDYESDGFARSNMGDVERVKWAIDWAEENLR